MKENRIGVLFQSRRYSGNFTFLSSSAQACRLLIFNGRYEYNLHIYPSLIRTDVQSVPDKSRLILLSVIRFDIGNEEGAGRRELEAR